MRHFAFAASLLALSACGGDNTVAPEPEPVPVPVPEPEPQEEAILFSGNITEPKVVTRTALNDNDGPDSFKVWAYKNDSYDASTGAYGSQQTVMDAYNVVFASGQGATGWEYIGRGTSGREQMIKYWDYGTKAYRFLAYAPSTASGVTVTTGGTPLAATMTLAGVDANNPATAPYVSELWFSNGNATLYPDRLFGKTVRLSFLKPFARVRFMFTFSYSVTHYGREALSNIAFGPGDHSKISFKGTMAITYPINGASNELTCVPTVATGAVFPDVADALVTDYTATNPHWYTVLPVSEQSYYELKVNVFGETRTAQVPASMMQWKAGYDYTYVFKIQEDGNVVLDLLEMAIHDWSEGTPRNHNFYNW